MTDSSGMLPFQMMIVDGVPWPNSIIPSFRGSAIKILVFSLGRIELSLARYFLQHLRNYLKVCTFELRHSAQCRETSLIFPEIQNDVCLVIVVN